MDFQYQLTVQFCKKYGIDQFRKKTELTNSVKNAELMVQFRKKYGIDQFRKKYGIDQFRKKRGIDVPIP